MPDDTLSPDQESHQFPGRRQRGRDDVSVQLDVEAGSVLLDKSENVELKARSSWSTGRDSARSINSRRGRGDKTVHENARSKQSISSDESDVIVEIQQRPIHLRVAMFIIRMMKKMMCERQTFKLEDAGVSIEEIEEMKMMSPFSDHKLRKLCGIFLHLDQDKKGFITLDELLSMPEMQANALKNRLACVWAHLENSEISFPVPLTSVLYGSLPPSNLHQDFVATLNVFSRNAPKEQKIKFLFKLYDVDADGKISRDDLTFCLELVCGEIVEMEVIEKMVEKVFEESDNNGDGFIDFRDFRETLIESDVELKVRLNV